MLIVLAAFCAAAALACTEPDPSTCAVGLRFKLSPFDTVVTPGQVFQSRLTVFGCEDEDITSQYILSWKSRDSTIVTVSSTGSVNALRSGHTFVEIFGTKTPNGTVPVSFGPIDVTVK